MIEKLVEIDKSLFLFLNGLNTPFFDVLMWHVSGNMIWLPLYATLLYMIFSTYRWRGFYVLFALVFVILLADRGSVILFKDVFERLRPCHDVDLNGMVHIVNGKCGGKFGFISSHASNTFAVAVFLALLFRGSFFCFCILFWAALVSYSRIYLGVHFPADVFCGAVFGTFIGWIIYRIFVWMDYSVVRDY